MEKVKRGGGGRSAWAFTFQRGKVYLQTYTDSIFCIFSNLQVKVETTEIILPQVYYCFQVETRMAPAGVSLVERVLKWPFLLCMYPLQ